MDTYIASVVMYYSNTIIVLFICLIIKNSQYWYVMTGAEAPVQPDIDHLGQYMHDKVFKAIHNVNLSILNHHILNKCLQNQQFRLIYCDFEPAGV